MNAINITEQKLTGIFLHSKCLKSLPQQQTVPHRRITIGKMTIKEYTHLFMPFHEEFKTLQHCIYHRNHI